MKKAVATSVLSLLLSACSTPSVQAPSQTTSDGRCSVYVYRTQTLFHSLNPVKPYVYVGDEQIGRLGVGESLCLRLPLGNYTISVRESVLFMPAWSSGKLDVQVTTDKTLYVRYIKDFGGVTPTPGGPIVTGNSRLLLSEDQGRPAK